jgi:hypothetical protein
MSQAVKAGAPVYMGIDHENYKYDLAPTPESTVVALAKDLA